MIHFCLSTLCKIATFWLQNTQSAADEFSLLQLFILFLQQTTSILMASSCLSCCCDSNCNCCCSLEGVGINNNSSSNYIDGHIHRRVKVSRHEWVRVRKGYTFNMGFVLPLPFVSGNFYPSVQWQPAAGQCVGYLLLLVNQTALNPPTAKPSTFSSNDM